VSLCPHIIASPYPPARLSPWPSIALRRPPGGTTIRTTRPIDGAGPRARHSRGRGALQKVAAGPDLPSDQSAVRPQNNDTGPPSAALFYFRNPLSVKLFESQATTSVYKETP
jgi:hypothetical protein